MTDSQAVAVFHWYLILVLVLTLAAALLGGDDEMRNKNQCNTKKAKERQTKAGDQNFIQPLLLRSNTTPDSHGTLQDEISN